MPRTRRWVYADGSAGFSELTVNPQVAFPIATLEQGETVGHTIIRSHLVSRIVGNDVGNAFFKLYVGVRLRVEGFATDVRQPNLDPGAWMLWSTQMAAAPGRLPPLSSSFASETLAVDTWEAETRGQRTADSSVEEDRVLGIIGQIWSIPTADQNPQWHWSVRSLIFSGPAASKLA